MDESDYIGTHTRLCKEAAGQDHQVAVVLTHKHYGRLCFELDRGRAKKLQTDLDDAQIDLELKKRSILGDGDGG